MRSSAPTTQESTATAVPAASTARPVSSSGVSLSTVDHTTVACAPSGRGTEAGRDAAGGPSVAGGGTEAEDGEGGNGSNEIAVASSQPSCAFQSRMRRQSAPSEPRASPTTATWLPSYSRQTSGYSAPGPACTGMKSRTTRPTWDGTAIGGAVWSTGTPRPTTRAAWAG